jgi:hypothetical protein
VKAIQTDLEPGAQSASHTSGGTAQFLYEAFYGGAIGGSAIALLFLLLDSLGGRPLFTPSAIGTALFTGTTPDAAAEIRLDMVAYYSAVHFAAFLLLGGVVSKMCRWTGLSRSSPTSVSALVFVLLTAAFFGGAWSVMPGIVSTIGIVRVLVANAATAVAMATFFYLEHRAG